MAKETAVPKKYRGLPASAFALAKGHYPINTKKRARSASLMSWTHGRGGSTRQSRRERTVVLTRWPTCYLHYDGCTIHSTEDDHVIPLSQGGTDSLDNRRGVCHHCHLIKSKREAADGKRAKRQRHVERHPGLI